MMPLFILCRDNPVVFKKQIKITGSYIVIKIFG